MWVSQLCSNNNKNNKKKLRVEGSYKKNLETDWLWNVKESLKLFF